MTSRPTLLAASGRRREDLGSGYVYDITFNSDSYPLAGRDANFSSINQLRAAHTEYTFEVFTRQRSRMWLTIDYLHDNLPERLKQNLTFINQMANSVRVEVRACMLASMSRLLVG